MSRTVSAERIAEELRHLPTRQASAGRLLTLLDDPLITSNQLARVAEQDPALTTRFLRLANSAMLGLSNPVGSASDAITVLGFAVVRSVAVSAAAGLFDGGRASLPDAFWRHSIEVAAATSLIGDRLDVPRGEAFSAGLVHDVGEALLYRMDPMRYKKLLRSFPGETAELLQAEQAAYGMTHEGVGAVALAKWKLPAALVDAVRYHHHPIRPGLEPLRMAVSLGQLIADQLAEEPEPSARPRLAAGLEAAGFPGLPIDALLEEVAEEIDGLADFEACL